MSTVLPPAPGARQVIDFHSVVLASMTEGVSVSDEAGTIVYTNPAEDRMFGYEPGELLGRHVSVQNDYDPAENARIVAQVIERLHSHGAWQGEWRNRRKDGSAFFTESRITVLKRGGQSFFVCVQRDVTRQRAEAQALRMAERRLSTLLASIDEHFVSYDANWRYTYVNDGAERVLGRPREELLGRCIWDLFPDAIGNQYYRELHEVARTGVPMVSDHYYAPFDTWFENRIYPSPDGVSVLSTDITARKRTEAALAQSERALREADRRKDEFLALLAHELRNPLAPVLNATRILGAGATPAQERQAREVIERQVRHMSRLLDDLLDVSRITRGKVELRPEPTSMARVLDSAVEAAMPAFQARGQTLALDAPPLEFTADTVRLAQVVSNLLVNAAKYTPPGGHIALRAGREGDQVLIEVADDGLGIAPADLDRIFEIFAQVRESRDRTEGGLGLGLALVKGVVELHGGTVQASSAGLGLGSTFTVRIPLREPAQAAAELPSQARAARKLRILVADDNADAREMLAAMLQLEGHEVTTAADGAEALAGQAASQPEVMLVDIGMPDIDGFEVAREVRRREPARRTRLVAITGWGQEEDRRLAAEAGFDEHLVKPVDPRALMDLLRSVAP